MEQLMADWGLFTFTIASSLTYTFRADMKALLGLNVVFSVGESPGSAGS